MNRMYFRSAQLEPSWMQNPAAEVSIATDTESYLAEDIEQRTRAYGRFMRADTSEYPCRSEAIDELNVEISTPIELEMGEYVVIYLDAFGRLTGTVTGNDGLRFKVCLDATPHKRRKVVETATALRLGKRITELPRFSRMRAAVSTADMHLEDGSKVQCYIEDMSLGGALLRTFTAPHLGSKVRVGRLLATVVRHTERGIAVQFTPNAEISGFRDFFGITSVPSATKEESKTESKTESETETDQEQESA